MDLNSLTKNSGLALGVRQYDYAEQLRGALAGSDLIKKLKLDKLLHGYKDQRKSVEKLEHEESINALKAALSGSHHERQRVISLIKLLMLHPLWTATEKVSSLLEILIVEDSKYWSIIDEIMDEDPIYWRLHYGAIDAAFNAGFSDDYQKFKALLLLSANTDDRLDSDQRKVRCRVRGICADDLVGWLRHSPLKKRRDLLKDSALRGLIRKWVNSADDFWLAEYVYLLFRLLEQDNANAGSDLYDLPDLFSDGLSRYFSDNAFYKLTHQDFLVRMEDIRNQYLKINC